MDLTLKQQRTQNDIVTTMEQLLETTPFDQITIALICQKALIHHSTFYRYFDDKYALLIAVFNNICAPMVESVYAGQSLMEAIINIFEMNKKKIRNITVDNKSNSLYADLINILSEQLYKAVQVDNPSADNFVQKIKKTANPQYMCYALSGMFIGIMMNWNNTNEQSFANDFAKNFNTDINQIFKSE